MSANSVLLFYVLLITPATIVLFLYGFFPIAHHESAIATQKDIPRYIDNIKVQTDILYKPMVRKVIIMVIDALRWDFVAHPMGKVTMPVMSNILENSAGCLLKAKLQSPTVTMPRIKAMMTGMVPNFVDIILNFGSDPLSSDNLLLQAKKHKHRLIFYGDDTWLALFPNIFERHDGTASFFVSDFTEVDNNVTRHIQDELNNDNWSIMILHYLGLDHIGHVEGPFGPSIKPKLKEMDNIIAQIAQKVQYWNDNDNSTLFIVCGDHGMKDSGGHGGSTPQETTVPLVTIGQTRCSYQEDDEIEQLDLAVTLSAALGLPIPSTNLGSIFLDSIYELTDSKRLFLLYYNSKQVFHYFQNLVDQELRQQMYQKYLDAVKMHVAWLNTDEKPSKMTENIILSYNTILKDMREILINNMIKCDVHLMIAAILCLCHVLCILFFIRDPVWSTRYKRTGFFFLLNISLWLMMIYYFIDFESTIPLYSMNRFNIPLILLIMSVLYINCHLLANVSSYLSMIKKMVKQMGMKRIFHIATLLHVISFASSSFIEEEHQTWYFFGATLLTYLLYYALCSKRLHHQHNSTRPFDTKICIKIFLLMIGHRILRKLNSTGDKYAHLPDIAGWLKKDDSKVGMTCLLLLALILLIWIVYECENKQYRQQSLILNTFIALCIYLRHASNDAVIKIPLYPASSGIYEVQMFWGFAMLFLIHCGYRIRLIIRYNRKHLMSTILFFSINIWVMVSALLHQPYNVILLPMQIIASSIIDTALKSNNFLESVIFVQYWLGNIFYFYQGNSNSLASIDIVAGYVGLRSYISFITGAYLTINTYSAPILAYLLLIYYQLLNQAHCDSLVQTSRIYITWRLLTMTVYTIIITIQRHHLFVWSVFSPKLLYESIYSVTMCCSVMLLLILMALQSKVSSY